jgi:hypothetical protein
LSCQGNKGGNQKISQKQLSIKTQYIVKVVLREKFIAMSAVKKKTSNNLPNLALPGLKKIEISKTKYKVQS